MKKIMSLLIYCLIIFTACAPQKRVFFFEEIIPPQVILPNALQEFADHPPLYIPKGNRKTIFVYSPHFTLAIPNAMDMTGRSSDLQRSLADILYTEMFNFSSEYQIDLMDRGALLNLDTKIILDSLFSNKFGTTDKTSVIEKRIEEIEKINNETEKLKKYLEIADGILLIYITSRVGDSNGYFEIDFRIVINKGLQEKIVLLAGSEKIHYKSNTNKQIEYKREDIKKIPQRIFNDMTVRYEIITKENGIKDKKEFYLIKFDPPFIVINTGKKHNLLPGMIGYVVERDKSVPNGMVPSDPHMSYIAEFIVTDVFERTSNALLIRPESDWDVRVNDVVIIK